MKVSNVKNGLLGIVFALALGVLCTTVQATDASSRTTLPTDLEYDASEMVFLSDLVYEQEMSYIENGHSFRFDQNASDQALSLLYNGEVKIFQKGISAWATSNLVYDISAYSYDKFTAYIGVDASQTNSYFNDGAVITIYTSDDGENWNVAYKTGTKKGVTDADYVEVSLAGVKYLRLYAYCNGASWWCPWYDDVLYADARLVKEGYVEDTTASDVVRTPEWYDEYLKNNDFNTEDYELRLLQRELVNNAGYDTLQFLLKYSKKGSMALEWLMNDEQALEYYVLGGVPDGTYKRSFEVLADLYKQYKDDMDVTEVTENGVVLGDLYKRMLITLSLTHSAPVGTWITGAPQDPNDPNGSNAVNRYFIYKKMNKLGLLENRIFEKLTVEEMRMVMNNIISDEEIEWLNYYSRTQKSDGMNPYTYIDYSFGYDYYKEQYYDPDMYDYWNEKYNLEGKGWDLTFKPTYGHTKLWIVFEENSVCGGIAKTGTSLQVAYGIPASVVGQPGHAAYIYMTLNAKGEKEWVLANDVSGWAQSGRTEKLHIRMPLGWGSGAASSGYVVSYFPLIQTAWDHYEEYKQAEEYVMLAKFCQDDFAKSKEYYRKALEAEKLNFDAWVGLIDLYAANGCSDADFVSLADEIAEVFTYYPLPMDNLLTYIGNHLTSEGNAFHMYSIRTSALNKAKNATAADVRQPNIAKVVAKYLAGDVETGIVDFTFDGYVATPTGVVARKDENGKLYAGCILLAEKFKGNEIHWQYMINGRDWKDAEGIVHKLTDEELAMVNEETDIKVRIVGALDIIYTVDITKADPPNIYGNDLENTIFGIDSNAIEYWDTGTGQWENALFGLYFDWENFVMREPIFEGNQVVYFRRGATMTTTTGDIQEVVFTEDNVDPMHSYIKRVHLKVQNVSSQNDTSTSDQAINGNAGDFWLTKNAETNAERRYITIALDEPVFLSALQYVPRQNGTSGMVRSAKIQVSMDNTNWTTVVASTNWEENAEAKYVAFEKPVKAKYVKVIGMETSDGYMSAALINLFEDTTAKIPPTATIAYSTTTLTNQDVTVTLYPDKCVEIADEAVTKQTDGTFTYTFTANGSYTFVFADAFGNIGQETATVSWIDKEPPKATVEYSTLDLTAGSVVATLKNLNSDDPITITNNGGSDTYTFTKNGSFLFTYEDAAGNQAETEAVVTWIVEEAPHILLEFSEEQPTNQPVTVTVVGDAEFVITSNDRQKSHVFYENGEWTFEYRTTAGFTGSITARVTWIDTEAPKGTITYSTKELTNQPVRATLVVDEVIIIDHAEGVERDESGNYYHTFTENGSFRFEYHDLAGNKGSQTATVSWIDTTPAEVTITYSKTTLTNETVVATLSSEEEITITNNNGSNIYLFDKNGSFEFVYVDRAGNVGKALAKVSWIDKQAPIGKIQYSTTEAIAGPVVATLVCDEEPIIVINNDGKTTHTFYENGRFQFVYQDEAGNIGTTYAEVTWIIDTDVRIEYSTTDPTNQNVTATVIPDERDITITNNNGSFSYTFTENGTFTFAYVDQSGKKETITAEVTWIDKEQPTFEVWYDYADPENPDYVTNQSVTATLISSEDIIIVNDSSSTVYGSVFTYVFDENAVLTLLYHDRAGNTGTYALKVDWIDKEPPVGTLTYSEQQKPTDPVTVTLTANEDIIIDNNGGSNVFTFNYNGIFEFLFHDMAGNTGSAFAEVTWIDDEPEVDNPPVILIEKDEFYFDLSTDAQVDLEYFKSLITIIDDRDEIDINDTEKVTITSGLEWMTGEYVITVTVKDSGGNIAVLQIKINIVDSSVDFTSLSFEIADGELIYNGNPHFPSVTVRNGVEVLTSMTDYTVSYTNNVNAGEATILVNGLGRYKGFVTLHFTILKARPTPDAYPDGSMEVSYDIEKAGDVVLPDGWSWLDPDASLEVGDNIVKAVYIIDDNYESLEVEITVTRLEQVIPNQAPVITIEGKEFIFDRRTSSGMDIVSYLKGFIRITDDRDGSIDVNNADQVVITIEPEFNWEVGIYTITVTATDSAGASSSETMTVEVIDTTVYMEQLTVELEEGEFVYNGSPQVPSVTVKYGDVVLTEKEHYEVAYENNIDAGEATVTVTGLGLYSGTKTLTFTIQKAQPEAPESSMEVPYGIEKAGEIALPEGWEWADPNATLHVGVNYLTARYAESKNFVSGEVTIEVIRAAAPTIDFTGLVFEVSDGEFVYNGNEHRPAVAVKMGTETLVENRDYVVSYKDNVNAGTATIIVTGLAPYQGTKEITFVIQKAKPDRIPETSMQVSADVEKAGEIDLPEGWSWAEPDAVLKTGENILEAVYEGDQNHEAMKITIVVTKEASAPTPDVTAPVISVEKDRYTFDMRTDAPIDMDYIKGLFTVTDDVDEDIQNRVQVTVVPEFKWEVGTYVVTVTATDMAGNVAEKQITIEIVNSTVDFAEVTIEIVGTGFVYNGSAHTPELIVKHGDVLLQAGRDYKVIYENNSNAGTATITVIGLDPYAGTQILYFEIAKAPQPEIVPDSTVEAGAEAEYAKDIELPEGWRWENPDAALEDGENVLVAIFDGDENHEAMVLEIIVTRDAEEDPETSDPETSDPETSDPETSDPETSDPETSDPETSDPENSFNSGNGEESSGSQEQSGQPGDKPDTSDDQSILFYTLTGLMAIGFCGYVIAFRKKRIE